MTEAINKAFIYVQYFLFVIKMQRNVFHCSIVMMMMMMIIITKQTIAHNKTREALNTSGHHRRPAAAATAQLSFGKSNIKIAI